MVDLIASAFSPPSLFDVGLPSVTDLPLEFDGSGILGLARTIGTLSKVHRALSRGNSPRGDERVAAEMVDRMKVDVARRTGALAEGITYRFEDGFWVVEAVSHAKRDGKEGADYAPFVEFGTEPHGGHPGTDAQAFFWQNAKDVLEEYEISLSNMVDDAVSEASQ